MIAIFLCLLTGIFAGTMSGLFGIGAGLILVPSLLYLSAYESIPDELVMHIVSGTSFTIMLFTSIFSALAHQRRHGIRWDIYRRLYLGVIIGVIAGALLANFLGFHLLRRLLGIFILLVSLPMLLPKSIRSKSTFPRPATLFLMSNFIGGNSGLLGVGGGAITVPFLTYCNVAIHDAVPISSAISFTIACTGTVIYFLMGWHVPNLPHWTVGYIYWPAALLVASSSMLSAPLGAKLFYYFPETTMQRLFAAFLVLNGIHLVV